MPRVLVAFGRGREPPASGSPTISTKLVDRVSGCELALPAPLRGLLLAHPFEPLTSGPGHVSPADDGTSIFRWIAVSRTKNDAFAIPRVAEAREADQHRRPSGRFWNCANVDLSNVKIIAFAIVKVCLA